MVKLIVGNKGSGKTKILINMINEAEKTADGSLVCVDKGTKLTYDISYKIRLADCDYYGIEGYAEFYGFICGILAGNHDIHEVYVDSILKVGNQDLEGLGRLLDRFESHDPNVKYIFTVSADENALPESVKKYV